MKEVLGFIVGVIAAVALVIAIQTINGSW